MERVFEVEVGLAMSRPPHLDEIRKYLIVARSPIEAELVALWMAGRDCVMPVSSRLVTGNDDGEA